MARLALAVSVFLSLYLLSPAQFLPSDQPGDAGTLTFRDGSTAIQLPSDKSSSSRADESASNPKLETAIDGTVPTEAIPIEASLVPIRLNFPYPRPVWRRLGHHCRHQRRGLRGGIHRGKVIPYGNDMLVSEEEMRRAFAHGRGFLGEAHPGRLIPGRMGGARWEDVERKEISVEELVKQREMGLPREMRPFRQWHPHREDEERHVGAVKRFLDFLNRH